MQSVLEAIGVVCSDGAVLSTECATELVASPIPDSTPSPKYKVICISMYIDDVSALTNAVKRCRRAGLSRMSKSQLIRIALQRLDLDAVIADMLPSR